MTEREKILREGLGRISDGRLTPIYGNHLLYSDAVTIARETIAKADAVPSSSLREAVKLERELIYDILLVAQMNGGYLPGHQMKAMMAWLDQPLPEE